MLWTFNNLKEDFRSRIQTDYKFICINRYRLQMYRLNLKEDFRSGIQTDITSLYILIDTDYK